MGRVIDLIGIIFICILGTLGHFLYEWSNHNKVLGILCAVNESTWEHIKLAIGPTFLWMIIEVPFIYTNDNFLFAKCVSLLVMMIVMPVMFYTYKIFNDKHNLPYTIFIFIVSIVLGQLCSYYILKMNAVSFIVNYISLIIIVIIFACYIALSFFPLENEIFKDPVSNKYGFDAHREYHSLKSKIKKIVKHEHNH